MVNVSGYGTTAKEGTAVITKKDGTKLYIKDGALVRETSASGRNVGRVQVAPIGVGAKARKDVPIGRVSDLKSIATQNRVIKGQQAQKKYLNSMRSQNKISITPAQRYYFSDQKKYLDVFEQKRLEKSPFRRISVMPPPRIDVPSAPSQSKLNSSLNQLERKIEEQKIKIVRNKIENKPALSNEASLLGLSLGATLIRNVKGIVDLPSTVKYIIRNPSIIAQIPREIQKSASSFGFLLRTSPIEAMGVIAGELLFLRGSTKTLDSLSKLKTSSLTRLSPKYKGVLRIGSVIDLGKGLKLRVVGNIPTETLKRQVAKAGSSVDAISSQADPLLTILNQKKLIRKPIPGENTFTKETKKLLAKLDAKTIKPKEFIKLNALIQKQGAKGLLERSFFIDPSARIRPSRLGISETSKKATFIDYITNNITFRKARPQILLFRNLKIQQFPKTKLFDSIRRKLQRNKPLNKFEADELLKWQFKTTGKAKPIGFVSGESEITLPAGEILKRKKLVGQTLVQGKKVPIIEVEVFKPSEILKNKLNDWRQGKLNTKQVSSLENTLKKQTGFNYGLSYSPSINRKYVNIKRLLGASSSQSIPSIKLSQKTTITPSRASPRPSPSRKAPSRASPRPSPSRKAPSRASPRPSPSRKAPSRASPRSNAKLIKSLRSVLSRAKKRLPTRIRNILTKKKPLTKRDQDDLILYVKSFAKSYRPSLSSIIFGFTSFKIPKNVLTSPLIARPVFLKK